MSRFTRRRIFRNIGICSAGAPPEGAALPAWAGERFLSHWNCAQAVLEAFAARYRMDLDLARKVSTAFAGGMCAGEMCGSFTGALMVIGLAHGGPGAPSKAAASRAVAFTAAMKDRFGSLSCSALLGTDMATAEGVRQAADKGLFATFCPRLVAESVRTLQDIL